MKLRERHLWDLTDPYTICDLDWPDSRAIREEAVKLRSIMTEDEIFKQELEVVGDIKRWAEMRGLTVAERIAMVREFLILDKALWIPWEELQDRARHT